MSRIIRQAISSKISQITNKSNVFYELELPAKKREIASAQPALYWKVHGELAPDELMSNLDFDKELVEQVQLLPAEGRNKPRLELKLNAQTFLETVLQKDAQFQPQHGERSNQHMVFDFSSPNIAKPFHVGHLRSTIIGNVLGNLHSYLGYTVTKLNYLGDWGTQFGMLQVGVEMQHITDEQMQQRPIETLYEAYVGANEAAKSDPTIVERARQKFKALESGLDMEMAAQWHEYRMYTVAALQQIYERLGVCFDQYDWESQYSQREIGVVLQNLADNSLILDELDGRKVVDVDGRRVPIMKSDGSTLYLARDIAALIDRMLRFNFERIFYVVDNSQTDHFNACFKTTSALMGEKLPLAKLKHVKFGRIQGMSTRSGNAVFLRDVLDEARDIMYEKQLKSPTTKVNVLKGSEAVKNIADILGVSAVIVNDLKQRRQRDYIFDWQRALQVNGDTGIKLQYTHCRLHSLLQQVVVEDMAAIKPDLALLPESEALDLVLEIARFEEAAWSAKEQLEACVMVNYLFGLCNTTSRALKRLNVKNESCVQRQHNRLLLFKTAKDTLQKGMQILGLKPLNEM